MKLKNIYCLLFCIIFLSARALAQDAIHAIRDFYESYTANILAETPSDSLPLKSFLTPQLIKKVGRMRAATGVDPIIRAQDFSPEAATTLSIKHLEGNWYMAGYDYSSVSKSRHTNIPLRVKKTGTRYLIDYITPLWHDSLYGDFLLCNTPAPPQQIDASTPLSLLKTFYAACAEVYCSMSDDVNAQLSTLRNDHLTPVAQAQFKAAAAKYRQDGSENYDLLIDYFDFDPLWLPSIKITPLDSNTWQVSYLREKAPCTVTLKVAKQGQKYKIDSIVKVKTE